MNFYELISIIISLIALGIAVASFFVNRSLASKANTIAERANNIAVDSNRISEKANESAKQANSVSLGNIELAMKQMITQAKERVSDLSLQHKIYLLKEDKNPQEAELLLKNFRAAIENTLNAYEEACAKYLDGKVDKKRFKQLYKTDIRQIVCDSNHKEFFDAITSPYKAILKVYDEWENLEK